MFLQILPIVSDYYKASLFLYHMRHKESVSNLQVIYPMTRDGGTFYHLLTVTTNVFVLAESCQSKKNMRVTMERVSGTSLEMMSITFCSTFLTRIPLHGHT